MTVTFSGGALRESKTARPEQATAAFWMQERNMQERHMCGRCFYAATMPAMVGRRTVLKLAATATAGLGFLPRALAQIAKEP
jgi:hypothetical protein